MPVHQPDRVEGVKSADAKAAQATGKDVIAARWGLTNRRLPHGFGHHRRLTACRLWMLSSGRRRGRGRRHTVAQTHSLH